jgi:hypothetical protein
LRGTNKISRSQSQKRERENQDVYWAVIRKGSVGLIQGII